MHNEIAKGENPEFTSFVGASAAPSHTPAVKPQITPKLCSDNPVFSTGCTVLAMDHSLLFSFCCFTVQRNTTSKAMPANNTKNGTRKWLSVAMFFIPLGKLILIPPPLYRLQ
jgi:hypothetical protein